jgi:hypothetical protein
MTPNWDAALAAEDNERHRLSYGFCLDPCEHATCHEVTTHTEEHELGDPVA